MIYRVALFGAIVAAAFGGGFSAGKQWCEGIEAEKDLAQEIEAKRLDALRQFREAERQLAARELEDKANADPVNDGCGLPVERVRRLNLR